MGDLETAVDRLRGDLSTCDGAGRFSRRLEVRPRTVEAAASGDAARTCAVVFADGQLEAESLLERAGLLRVQSAPDFAGSLWLYFDAPSGSLVDVLLVVRPGDDVKDVEIEVSRQTWLGGQRRSLVGPATITALVGADGTGKSTLVADLVKWARPHLVVEGVFNGQPKRDRSVMLLRRASQFPISRVASFADELLWLRVARYRQLVFRRSDQLRRTGVAIVSDRYPLVELRAIGSSMDSPRLTRSRLPVPHAWAAEMERKRYAQIDAPDLTILLEAPLDVLQRRKPDTPLDEHRTKVEAVAGLVAMNMFVRIDASRSYEVVFGEVKRAWFEGLVAAQARQLAGAGRSETERVGSRDLAQKDR